MAVSSLIQKQHYKIKLMQKPLETLMIPLLDLYCTGMPSQQISEIQTVLLLLLVLLVLLVLMITNWYVLVVLPLLN